MTSLQISEPAGTAACMVRIRVAMTHATAGAGATLHSSEVEAGAVALHRRLSDALLVQLQGGSDAPILQMELEVRAAGLLSGPASMDLCLGRHPSCSISASRCRRPPPPRRRPSLQRGRRPTQTLLSWWPTPPSATARCIRKVGSAEFECTAMSCWCASEHSASSPAA